MKYAIQYKESPLIYIHTIKTFSKIDNCIVFCLIDDTSVIWACDNLDECDILFQLINMEIK